MQTAWYRQPFHAFPETYSIAHFTEIWCKQSKWSMANIDFILVDRCHQLCLLSISSGKEVGSSIHDSKMSIAQY